MKGIRNMSLRKAVKHIDSMEYRIDKNESGFTLLEVMAAVVIIGVSMTVIMTDRNDSIRRVAETDAIRTATILGQQKINEILVGVEAGSSGVFDGRDDISWRLEDTSTANEVAEGLENNVEWLTLVISYPVGGAQSEIKLFFSRGVVKE